jgi:hypothetical protein
VCDIRKIKYLSKAHRYIADERTSPGAPQIIALSLYPQALTIPYQLNPNSPDPQEIRAPQLKIANAVPYTSSAPFQKITRIRLKETCQAYLRSNLESTC